jgi:glyoxylase I family protein
MPGWDHVDLVVTDIERSLAFYRDLLRPLGWSGPREITGEQGETVHYLGTIRGFGALNALGLRQKRSDAHEVPYDRYAIGVHHIAFGAPSRRKVDEIARGLDEVESGPREYDYTPGYYAVFFRDPDGIKLEIVHRPRLRFLVSRLRRR